MTDSHSDNTRRIAKNTLALYVRTFITMCVGLYTGRVMLDALGIDNYGIRNVVGGIIDMSSIITGTMAGAISRYITFALGEGDKERLNRVFSTSVNVQIIMAVTAVVIMEIIGVWFLNTQANIPDGRMYAANWVMQCAIIVMAVSLVCVPFSAAIISHERLTLYAYLGIVNVFINLIICLYIKSYGGDRLIMVSILYAIANIGITAYTCYYSIHNFTEARFRKIFDKKLLKEMTSFAGWNLFGNSAWTLNTQGVNMLVNIFFGVTFNAARGVATMVNGVVQRFVNDFTTAFTPQITKSYASGDLSYMLMLVIRGTKFTWLLMYIFIVPVFIEADTLLGLWLVDVPPLASTFLRFTLFESLALASGGNLFKAIMANGNIKRYQIEITMWGCIVFPLSWIAFKFGAPVWMPYLIFIITYFGLNIVRLRTLKRLMDFPVWRFMKEGIYPCLIVSVVAFLIPGIIGLLLQPGIIRFIIVVPVSIIWASICCYYLGFSESERTFIVDKAKLLYAKIRR